MGLDVLVVGSGGREHALIRALKRSPYLGRLYCAPGNAGMAADAQAVPLSAQDIGGLVDFAVSRRVDLTVVGPEAPLVEGLADALIGKGLAVFGPTAEGARLEGSKVFAKEVMEGAGVPTGRAASFTALDEAMAHLRRCGVPVVVKADGLAAGKGVTVARNLESAEEALIDCFVARRFGDSGSRVLLEECLEGEELSMLALVSGDRVLPLALAQDYKRAYDGDEGPNTGGMGSYSPVPSVGDELYERIVEQVLRPTVAEVRRRGIDYRGVLYAGLILTDQGPRVLEFNCRFGDPETQALMPRLRSDLLGLLWAAARGDDLPAVAEWSPRPCVGVVVAAGGYPAAASKGAPISGLDAVAAMPDVEVFHAGTMLDEGRVATAGGRVLTVAALGDTFAEARSRAYEAVRAVSFEGARYRCDIGLRAELMERRAAEKGREE